ncbi:hypothetical protein BN2475_720044 [Paraburkholderia ribeironis]|uniref:DNA ligase (ATP) n=1 Tax=Paraburkholderia ribeironis TaxID=1247936 RepID=A0A1N7SIU5_9BURK|nr:hypothetical protein BN2475_720044 [Paraburkholderia ribeironis]
MGSSREFQECPHRAGHAVRRVGDRRRNSRVRAGARVDVRSRPHQGIGHVVEIEDREDRSLYGGCRTGLRATRSWPPRQSLTDFTFAVWDEANGVCTLVPFATAYSGLTDEEMREVDAIVRKTTVEKFGPLCSVTPTLVFEIGFEGIQASPRHKSGGHGGALFAHAALSNRQTDRRCRYVGDAQWRHRRSCGITR